MKDFNNKCIMTLLRNTPNKSLRLTSSFEKVADREYSRTPLSRSRRDHGKMFNLSEVPVIKGRG